MSNVQPRVHLCTQCGAPVEAPAQGNVVRCEYCGAQVLFGLRPAGPVQFANPQAQLGLSEEQMEAARLVSLAKQAEYYDASSNPYCYIEAPDDLEYIAATDELSAEFLPMALQAFNMAIARCQASGCTLEDQRRVYWIARKLKNSWSRRDDPLKARAVIETAYDLLPDPGYRQLFMCSLSDMARKEGNLALAEDWLSKCDPRPPLLDLDTDYRTSWALLLIAREQWGTALALVGEERGTIPYEPSSVAVFNAIRVSSLARLGRREEAIEDLRFIIDETSLAFVENMFANSQAWAPAAALLAQMKAANMLRDSVPGDDDDSRSSDLSEPRVEVPEAIGWWFLGVLVVPVVVGGAAVGTSIDSKSTAEAMAAWKSTPGEVVKTGFTLEEGDDSVSIHAQVLYGYTVDGVKYTNDYIGLDSESYDSTAEAERAAERWDHPGLMVYYDPDDPQDSALDISPDPFEPVGFVIGGIAAIAFLVMLVIFVRSHLVRLAALRRANA